jgi:uncharacterized membrane protein
MWFAVGLVIGAGIVALAFWLNKHRMQVKWYVWLMSLVGILLAIWAVHDFSASMAEYNEIAAWTLLWLLGIPGIILLVLSSLLPWLQRRQTSRK